MAVGKIRKIGQKIRADANVSRTVNGIVRGVGGLPAGTGRYLIAKIPAARWLPNYSPIWLIDDMIAGLSVGVLLVPQALVYSVLAGMPLKDALLASWLPSLIYTVMGTSKGMSSNLLSRKPLANSRTKISASGLLRQQRC